MKLIKLLGFCTLGYLAYHLGQALCRKSQSNRFEISGSRDLRRALNEDAGRMNVTGPARGMDVVTEDSDGAQSHHLVGRGVIR